MEIGPSSLRYSDSILCYYYLKFKNKYQYYCIRKTILKKVRYNIILKKSVTMTTLLVIFSFIKIFRYKR